MPYKLLLISVLLIQRKRVQIHYTYMCLCMSIYVGIKAREKYMRLLETSCQRISSFLRIFYRDVITSLSLLASKLLLENIPYFHNNYTHCRQDCQTAELQPLNLLSAPLYIIMVSVDLQRFLSYVDTALQVDLKSFKSQLRTLQPLFAF